MAVFLLLVRGSRSREAIEGALASPKKADCRIARVRRLRHRGRDLAAVNWGGRHALRGWAIPAATEHRLCARRLRHAGRKCQPSLKTFLLALAIIDDRWPHCHRDFLTADLSVLALALGGLGRRPARGSQPARGAQTVLLSDRRAIHLGLCAQIRRSCDAGRRRPSVSRCR